MRLASPLQSWGIDSKYTRRNTQREPTKSGIIGLVANALGIQRDDEVAIQQLARLEFAVRIDQVGTILRDFHMARTSDGKQSFVTERYYLADAIFIAGLSGSDEELQRIEAALHAPKYPLYLGRRSCPPTGQVSLGMRQQSLLDAISSEPWHASSWYTRKFPVPPELEIVADAASGVSVQDVPESFSFQGKKYGYRSVDRLYVIAVPSFHDAISELGG
ncbi:MAG: type I-E CRISPR-associated protein Cas5/CasD [Eubacteriaceae bacterium]|nr:type I-E CRISPR-associated protein Cas5/CasD [Eubacteriaceae bacterium]